MRNRALCTFNALQLYVPADNGFLGNALHKQNNPNIHRWPLSTWDSV